MRVDEWYIMIKVSIKKDVHVNEVIYNSLYYNFYHDAQQKIIMIWKHLICVFSTRASNYHLLYHHSPDVLSALGRQTSLKDNTMSFRYHLFGEGNKFYPCLNEFIVPTLLSFLFPSIPTHGGVRIIVKIDVVVS